MTSLKDQFINIMEVLEFPKINILKSCSGASLITAKYLTSIAKDVLKSVNDKQTKKTFVECLQDRLY